ncbi:MAG: hypothetical protein OXC42_04725 [Gammaproteobacteria bacterium]|nr:hypothetical protein [Gammaproteobacteria bacterium]
MPESAVFTESGRCMQRAGCARYRHAYARRHIPLCIHDEQGN